MTTAEWRVNHEHHGLEIEFPGKPPQEIRTALKQNGFRWSRYSGVWYAKDYPHRREFLATLATRGEDVEDPGLSFAEKGEFGLGVVRRANPKTVTVDWLNPALTRLNPQKCEYGRIKEKRTIPETIALIESRMGTEDESPALVALLGSLRNWSA